jgi:hypothetical protein
MQSRDERYPNSFFCVACRQRVEVWKGLADLSDPDRRAAIRVRRCWSCARDRKRTDTLGAALPTRPRGPDTSRLSEKTRLLLQPYDPSKPVIDEDWR